MEKAPRILIIDCDDSFVESTKRALTSSFHVTNISTAEEAIKKVKKENPDIVILGYLEPRGNSKQVAIKLSEDTSTMDIPILIIDVRPEEYSRKGWRWSDGFSHNIKGYTWRPIDAIELKKTVAGVLQRVKASAMNLTEVAEQTEEMLKRIDQLKKLLMSETENK